MTDISWMVLLLFLPFCLTMGVRVLDGILEIFSTKPVVVIQGPTRYKEKVVYKDRVKEKVVYKDRVVYKAKPKYKTKSKKMPTVTAQDVNSQIKEEVLISLCSLGVSKINGKRLINKLVQSGKKYLDSESLLKDCLNSM